MDTWWLDSKFSTTIYQYQIENPVKCMKTLAFCQKNGFVMQNHGLGINSVKSPIGQNMLELKRKTLVGCP